MVKVAVRLPAEVGLVSKVTVKAVGVALVTLPTAPLLKVTRLLVSTGSKPEPLMTSVDALAERLRDELATTTGTTVAT